MQRALYRVSCRCSSLNLHNYSVKEPTFTCRRKQTCTCIYVCVYVCQMLFRTITMRHSFTPMGEYYKKDKSSGECGETGTLLALDGAGKWYS